MTFQIKSLLALNVCKLHRNYYGRRNSRTVNKIPTKLPRHIFPVVLENLYPKSHYR